MTESKAGLGDQLGVGTALTENVKDYAIFLLTPDGTVASWSAGAQVIKGYAASEIIGQSFARFYTPEDVAAGKPGELLGRAARDGRVEEEGWRVRKDGSHFWADVVISAVYGQGGAVRGFVKVTRDLSRRRAAEEKLRQSEERLRLFIESVKDYAIFMLDPDGRIASWNSGAQRIKGYREDEVIGKHFSMFYPPEDVAQGKPDRALRLAAERASVHDQGWRIRKNGERFWADVLISSVRDESGKLHGFAKITRDLTDGRRAEELIRQSELRTQMLIGSVEDYAIFMLDRDGHVATWNRGAERIKGYTEAEVVGRPISLFYPPEDVQAGKPADLLRRAAAEGRVEDEALRVRKDGSRFWADVVISRIQDDAGNLIGFAKVTRDLTRRKQAEEDLAAHARQQAAVARLGVFALEDRNLDAVIRRATETVRETLAVQFVDVLELSSDGAWLAVRAASGPDAALSGRARVQATPRTEAGATLLTGQPVLLDSQRFEPDETLRRLNVEGGITVVIHGSGPGSAYGVLGAYTTARRPFSATDVDFLQAVANVLAAAIDRRSVEEQLREAERRADEEGARTVRAREALRERDEFISVAAHELRTPLTALQLKLQSLERALETVAGQGRDGRVRGNRIGGALRQTERLAGLVERLLDVSRMAGGRLALDPEEFDLAALVRQVADDFREPAALAGSEIQVDAAAHVVGSWDRLRLEQVLVNLLSNAVKYGAGRPISVRLAVEQERVNLTVADRGIGIEAEDLPRIFTRFERAAPLRKYGGLGLGLYISKHIIDAHRGEIHVSSRVGEGSTFVVNLPRFAVRTPALPGGQQARA